MKLLDDRETALIRTIEREVHPLTAERADYDPLIRRIGTAPFVLLGEASHGSHEFYRERAEITKRLIADRGFAAVVVEADWPDAYRVNCYVRGASDDLDATEALAGFRRFPTWMWRNTVVVEFVEWLRAYNDALPKDAPKVGFYGMDLYSLHASMKAVLRVLAKLDPDAAKVARERYACFEHFGPDPQIYGFIARTSADEACREQAIAQLVELQQRSMAAAQRDDRVPDDQLFYAEQNARVVVNAEQYYRAMFLEEVSTWNLRDRHMVGTVEAVAAHLARGREAPVKLALWAHNSHLGDARATAVGRRGELNVGQLVREKHGHDAVLIGFTTHSGTVTAASDWDGPAERKHVRPGLPGSYEKLFHAVDQDRFLLLWDNERLAEGLRTERLERAIGVIYRPQTERVSHYFSARLADQFDAVIHIDQTTAVEPLERTAGWERGEVPETYPVGV